MRNGFAPISRSFLRRFRDINVSMEEAMLILQIMDMVWMEDSDFPTTRLLSKRLGKSEPTVRLYLRSLEMKGMLIPKKSGRNYDYDWSPLIAAVKAIPQIDFTQESESDNLDSNKDQKSSQSLNDLMRRSMDLADSSARKRKPMSKPKRESILEAYERKSPSQYNSNDLEFVLSEAWGKKGWNTPAPKFYPKDRKLSKQLLENYGGDRCDKVIRTCISKWEDVSSRFRINGYPSMGIFWGFRNTLFPYVLDEHKATQAWGSKFNNKDEREEGSEIGW